MFVRMIDEKIGLRMPPVETGGYRMVDAMAHFLGYLENDIFDFNDLIINLLGSCRCLAVRSENIYHPVTRHFSGG
jgi:hypothetical protein